ncbi:MAG: hypothetical protein ABI165_03360 [Bryobacteraceae bacterium]
MRLTTIAMLAIPVALMAGDANQNKNNDAKPGAAPAAKADAARPATLPDGAKEVAPYTYKWTDRQGKKWVYRQTPFGFSRQEDKPAPATAPEPAAAGRQTIVVEDGDVVHFERATPFGSAKWTKPKSELTADEKALLERQQQQKSGSESKTTAGKEQ